MLTRRRLVAATLAALAAPCPAHAQRAEKVHRLGILSLGSSLPGHPDRPSAYWDPFIDEMRALSYAEGRNLTIRYAGADADPDRLASLAAALIRSGIDVLVTTGPRETLAAKTATGSIPIVMTLVPDPIEAGLVAGLARPGGNVTGLSTLAPGLHRKYVELLHEFVPSATRFAIVVALKPTPEHLLELEDSGRAFGVTLITRRVTRAAEFDAALSEVRKDGASGIIVTSDVLTQLHAREFVHAALKHRLPGMYWNREYVDEGGLMSYGANYVDLRRRAAHYVDRILRGAKPADLPVEQPTRFELVINQKTARVLGLAIPASLLARADQLID